MGLRYATQESIYTLYCKSVAHIPGGIQDKANELEDGKEKTQRRLKKPKCQIRASNKRIKKNM